MLTGMKTLPTGPRDLNFNGCLYIFLCNHWIHLQAHKKNNCHLRLPIRRLSISAVMGMPTFVSNFLLAEQSVSGLY